MSKPDKWSQAVTPDQPVASVARRALADRFAAVQEHLVLAADKPDEDPEHVHQLRVATRRALAAMDVFSDLLPVRRVRGIRAELKRLRRAAGDARDLDVLVERLRQWSSRTKGGTSRQTIERIVRHRRWAQKPIGKARARLDRTHFGRRLRGVVRRIRWRCSLPEARLGEFAQTVLCPMVSAFFAAATADLSDIDTLHAMRIRGKKLRYTLELLAAGFDRRAHKALRADFEQLQTKLGEINDWGTAQVLFQHWLERSSDRNQTRQLRTWLAKITVNLEDSCRRFRRWWTRERIRSLRRQFDCMLVTRPPGRGDR